MWEKCWGESLFEDMLLISKAVHVWYFCFEAKEKADIVESFKSPMLRFILVFLLIFIPSSFLLVDTTRSQIWSNQPLQCDLTGVKEVCGENKKKRPLLFSWLHQLATQVSPRGDEECQICNPQAYLKMHVQPLPESGCRSQDRKSKRQQD